MKLANAFSSTTIALTTKGTSKHSQALSNPYVAGSPVSRAEMFFGRADVFDFIRSALVGQHQDNVIVLYGKRRTGKTSVLYQMHRNIEPRYLPILIDLQALTMDSSSGFFWEVASTIRRALRREYQIDVPRPQREDFEADPLQGFQDVFLNPVVETLGGRHLLLMIDESARLDEQVQAGKLPSDVFGHIRSLMQHNTSLNFIFCVGERLEMMRSQYALLFNVALYKEISFLDRQAAESLIAQPTQGVYSYEPAAVDRIIEITSGHAYFMQLLCHSLFASWQRDNKAEITVEDVNGVTSEVVERGAANLKFDWDESLPAEKLFLGAMAEAMADGAQLVTLKDVDDVLRRYEILVPQGELVSAQRSLIEKELVFGAEDMRFAVDFLRLWVRQHERLEWVKEELSTEIEQLREVAEAEIEAAERRATRRRFRWGSLVSAVALAIALLLFVPGSPLRVFSASTVTEEVKVVQTIDFTEDNRCGFQTQGQGADLAMCLNTVDTLSDNTIRVNVKWHASITSDQVTAVGRGKSDVGDALPHLQDTSGNTYNFTGVGGSAAAPFSLRHGESEEGWFLFPPLAEGVSAVTLVDKDVNTGQEMRIEGIVLE